MTYSESEVGPLIIKTPPPLPKPRRVKEPKPKMVLSHTRALQTVKVLATIAGVLLLVVVVLVAAILRTDTRGTQIHIYYPNLNVSAV